MAENKTSENSNKAEFRIRPPPGTRFNKKTAEETIHAFLNDELTGKDFSTDEKENEQLSRQLSRKLKYLLRREINADYKLVVHVLLSQLRGAGIRSVSRCLWDSANDSMTNVSFENERLFCVATLFAIYSY